MKQKEKKRCKYVDRSVRMKTILFCVLREITLKKVISIEIDVVAI